MHPKVNYSSTTKLHELCWRHDVDLASFEIIHGIAGPRVGRLVTSHGEIDTPAFFPVGTHGAVRGLTPQELRSVSVQGILANTYHLHLRPGEQTIARLGGLHAFMAWDGPILTDSGGYQVYSLDRCCERTEDGAYFHSPYDGSRVFLGPERCIAIQEALGADLVVSLDEFEPIGGPLDEAVRQRIRGQMERTLRWAARCHRAHHRRDQLLFGVVQGGGFHDLRRESAERTAELGFRAFALGGFGLGEPAHLRSELVETAVTALPAAAPRYLMGLGTPHDLVEGGGMRCRFVRLHNTNPPRPPWLGIYEERSPEPAQRPLFGRPGASRRGLPLLRLHELFTRISAPSDRHERYARRALALAPQHRILHAASR